MISFMWFAVFDAAIYFAPTFAWVIVLRTLFGFGMGAEWTAGTALAMESFPAAGRGSRSGLLQAGWPVGYLLARRRVLRGPRNAAGARCSSSPRCRRSSSSRCAS